MQRVVKMVFDILRQLCEQVLDHFAATDDCNRPTGVTVILFSVVDAQVVVERGRHIVG